MNMNYQTPTAMDEDGDYDPSTIGRRDNDTMNGGGFSGANDDFGMPPADSGDGTAGGPPHHNDHDGEFEDANENNNGENTSHDANDAGPGDGNADGNNDGGNEGGNENEEGKDETIEEQIPANQIELGIKDLAGGIVHFRIKKAMVFKKLFQAYASKEGKDMLTLRFLFDGEKLLPTQTPQQMEMLNGDMIDVVMEQTGGGGKN